MADKETKDKNWFAKHKVLTVFLVLILIGVIGSAAGGSKSSGTTGSKTNQEQANKFDIETFYASVENGMSKAKVTELAGKQAGSCTSSAVQGLGETELCTWSSFKGVATVTFSNDQVNSKSKTGF